MPNWTANQISAQGETAHLRSFLEHMKSGDVVFDFNKLIPMPELLTHSGSGSQVIDGKRVEYWYISERDEHGFEKASRLFTAEEEAELAAIGFRDWYDWSIAKWGTKWNACQVEIEDSSEYEEITITFDTAWNAPVPILLKMIEMFPKLTFDCRWRHEDESPYPHSLGGLAVTGDMAA